MHSLQHGQAENPPGSSPKKSSRKRDPTPDERTESQVFQQIESARKRWERDREAIPGPPQLPPKAQSLMAMEIARNSAAMHLRSIKAEEASIYTSTIGQKVNCSRTPLKALKPIMLREMLTHQFHKGRYLLCRVACAPDRKVATELMVEDPDGTVVFLALYNFIGLFQALQGTLNAFLPMGQLLAIREPWMKQPAAGDGNSMIRVDCPSDIVFLSGNEPMLARMSWKDILPTVPYRFDSALKLKAQGTTLYKSKLFIPAARLWSLAIAKDPSIPELFLNRSQVYNTLGWHEAALRDAEKFIAHFPSSPLSFKAVYRAATAEYGLGRYISAISRFKTLPEDIGKLWVAKCDRRIAEAASADYDWVDLVQSSKKAVIKTDVADYIGPVKVCPITGKGGGRGVVATREVTTGEVLVVSRAFASIFPSELVEGEEIFAMNLVTKRIDDASCLGLIHKVVEKLHGCPERSSQVLDLYGGPDFSHSPDSYDPNLRIDVHLDTPLVHAYDLDLTRIGHIISLNAFGAHDPQSSKRAAGNDLLLDELDVHARDQGSCLHTLPSLFNHACHSNAVWHSVGDVIVIRATSKISLGEEITISYINGSSEARRAKRLKKWLDGGCNCRLCIDDRSDELLARTRRDDIMEKWKDSGLHHFHSKSPDPEGDRIIEGVLEGLKPTYQADRVIRVELSYIHMEAMKHYQKRWALADKYDERLVSKSIQHGFDALSCAGFIVVDTGLTQGTASTPTKLPISKDNLGCSRPKMDESINTMLYIARIFANWIKPLRAKRWFCAACWGEFKLQALYDNRG
ncbi:hypothetical protein DL93DRAFT_2069446 [Clavulina sp. PMI_390]|nr:hypothetical protein DL93DRAFT_2069446 [Clavulina sp. PMI_390]